MMKPLAVPNSPRSRMMRCATGATPDGAGGAAAGGKDTGLRGRWRRRHGMHPARVWVNLGARWGNRRRGRRSSRAGALSLLGFCWCGRQVLKAGRTLARTGILPVIKTRASPGALSRWYLSGWHRGASEQRSGCQGRGTAPRGGRSGCQGRGTVPRGGRSGCQARRS
jgi:hypothetical protein